MVNPPRLRCQKYQGANSINLSFDQHNPDGPGLQNRANGRFSAVDDVNVYPGEPLADPEHENDAAARDFLVEQGNQLTGAGAQFVL
jgi:hypothetical protein